MSRGSFSFIIVLVGCGVVGSMAALSQDEGAAIRDPKDIGAEIACLAMHISNPRDRVAGEPGELLEQKLINYHRDGDRVICSFRARTRMKVPADFVLHTLSVGAVESIYIKNPALIERVGNTDEVKISNTSKSAECLFGGCYYDLIIEEETSLDRLNVKSGLVMTGVAAGLGWSSAARRIREIQSDAKLSNSERDRLTQANYSFAEIRQRSDEEIVGTFKSTCIDLSIDRESCIRKARASADLYFIDGVALNVRTGVEFKLKEAKERSLGF